MKKLQLTVFAVLSSFIAVACASSDSNPFNQPVPVQSFQTASSPSKTPAKAHPAVKKTSKTTAAASEKAQMAKVESIMNQSKQDVDSGLASKHPDTMPTKTASVPAATSSEPKTNSAVVKELESQMSELNQAELLYQQNTNQKIDTLTSQNEAMQAKLTKLTEAMLMINQELSQIVPKGTSAASHMRPPASQNIESTLNNSETFSSETWSQKIQARFHGPTIYLAFTIVILLVFLMAILLRQNNVKTATSKSSSDDDTREEYDFMGSNEAIPAKLDLARTYIDMGDKSAARKVLDEVIQKGDNDQKKIASELLKKTQ